MDDRDESLLTLLESGDPLSDELLIDLVGILSQRKLGPDTISGIRVCDMRIDDLRYIAHTRRIAAAEQRALELLKGSRWYENNSWPDGGTGKFRSWVDLRLNTRLTLNAHNQDFD